MGGPGGGLKPGIGWGDPCLVGPCWGETDPGACGETVFMGRCMALGLNGFSS